MSSSAFPSISPKINLRLHPTPPTIKIIFRAPVGVMVSIERRESLARTAKANRVVKSSKNSTQNVHPKIKAPEMVADDVGRLAPAMKPANKKDAASKKRGHRVAFSLPSDHLEPPFKRFWREVPDRRYWVDDPAVDGPASIKSPTWEEPTLAPKWTMCEHNYFTRSQSPSPSPSLQTFPDHLPVPRLMDMVFPTSSVRDEPIPGNNFTSIASELASPFYETEPTTLYFAYSTDMRISNMRRVYPGIKFMGLATLPDFRWFVGARNMPIITAAAGEVVHGVLYEIPTEKMDDVKRRMRGGKHVVRSVRLYDELERDVGWGVRYPWGNWGEGEKTAVVFVGEGDEEGVLDEDSVLAMNRGIVEVRMEGMAGKYADEVLRKWVPLPKTPAGIYW